MLAEKMLEALPHWMKPGALLDDPDVVNVHEHLEKATRFKFDFVPPLEMRIFSIELAEMGIIRLPYSSSYFEWPHAFEKGVCCCFCMEVQGQVAILGATYYQERKELVLEATGRLFLNQTFEYKGEKILAVDRIGRSSREAYDNLVFFAHGIGGLIVALNSKSTSSARNDPPEKLNKRRKKRGKPPLQGFTEVSLRLPSDKNRATSQGGTHAPPRMHWRRGHIRRLPNSKKIYIAPMLVGASEEGVVQQQYRATMSKPEKT